jgi:hypothetical protein
LESVAILQIIIEEIEMPMQALFNEKTIGGGKSPGDNRTNREPLWAFGP